MVIDDSVGEVGEGDLHNGAVASDSLPQNTFQPEHNIFKVKLSTRILHNPASPRRYRPYRYNLSNNIAAGDSGCSQDNVHNISTVILPKHKA